MRRFRDDGDEPMEPLNTQRNCAHCQHFDGDVHCSLPLKDALIRGAILEPESVVCGKFELHEDVRNLAEMEAADKSKSIEGIAYENKLSQAGGQY